MRPARLTRLCPLLAWALSLVFALDTEAVLIRSSQMVGFPSGNLGSAGSSEAWSGGSGNVTVTSGSGSLDGVPLGLAPSAGDKAEISATDGLATYCLFTTDAFPRNTTTNAYFSFLYRFNNADDVSISGERILQINRQNSGSAYTMQVQAMNDSGQLRIGINKTNGTVAYAPNQISSGQTVLVVVRHQIFPGANNDIVDLWVNPPTNAFGIDEASVPNPGASASDGGEDPSNTSPGRFYVASGANATFDELRVGTTWADVTPPATTCEPASVLSDPTDQTLNAELPATFSITPGGTSPTFQWQISTNSGASWDGITGAIAQNYRTPNLNLDDNGNLYRCIVSVSCGESSSATSAVASLTVVPPVSTPTGVIVDDRWADYLRDDPPVTQSNSVWRGSLLDASTGSLVATPAAGSSRHWIGYFTDDSIIPAPPVHLDVGRALRATIVFMPRNPVTNGGGSMRFGLFDYADGGSRLAQDPSGGSTGNGVNVRGYMIGLNFGTTFNDNTPLEIYARNNLASANLMGTVSDYVSLGEGPGGLDGAAAFSGGVAYTMEFQVTRTTADSASVSASITDGTNRWTFSVTDTNYAYHRFDAFGIRPNSLETTAEDFTFTRFLVEVMEPALPFRVTGIERLSSDEVKLSWDSVSNRIYQVQSREVLDAGSWITNATVTADGPSTCFTNIGLGAVPQRFYRVLESE